MASSIRSRSPRPGPRRPRTQAVNGSGHESGSVAGSPSAAATGCDRTAVRSRAVARSSSTRSPPSPRADAASLRLPPVTRTSSRTVMPPGRALDAEARSTSTDAVKSSATIRSAQSGSWSEGILTLPDACALTTSDAAASRRTTIRSASSDISNGTVQRSMATCSASVVASQTANRSSVASPATWRPVASSDTSRRRSAIPSTTYGCPNLVATTVEAPSGSRFVASVIVRPPSAAAGGDEIDQPPSRTSTAAAAAGIVARSSCTGSPGGGAALGCPTTAAPSECRRRPAAVQPASDPSACSEPAAITSESRQATR